MNTQANYLIVDGVESQINQMTVFEWTSLMIQCKLDEIMHFNSLFMQFNSDLIKF